MGWKLSQGTLSGLVNSDGTLTVRIPDRSSAPIYIPDQFTYKEGRDLRAFTREALSATEALIDGLLDAFQEANDLIRALRVASPRS